jgi:hypothetical protein
VSCLLESHQDTLTAIIAAAWPRPFSAYQLFARDIAEPREAASIAGAGLVGRLETAPKGSLRTRPNSRILGERSRLARFERCVAGALCAPSTSASGPPNVPEWQRYGFANQAELDDYVNSTSAVLIVELVRRWPGLPLFDEHRPSRIAHHDVRI